MISLREIELTAGQCIVEQLDGATLQFTTFAPQFTVPCTITKLLKDFDFGLGGKSPKTMLAICIFRASLIPAAAQSIFDSNPKGVKCTLKVKPSAAPVNLQLSHGGLMPGGAVYQFTLLDANYKG